EDGIRDYKVTEFRRVLFRSRMFERFDPALLQHLSIAAIQGYEFDSATLAQASGAAAVDVEELLRPQELVVERVPGLVAAELADRSEERRVGKECSAGWSEYR